MSIKTLTLCGWAILALALAPIHATQAVSSAYNSVWLDWSALTVTGIDTGSGIPTISWRGDETTDVSASNEDIFELDFSNDWTTHVDASVVSDSGAAESLADSEEVFAYTYVDMLGGQYAIAFREASFQVIGSGIVEFSLPYRWEAELVKEPTLDSVITTGLYALLEIYTDVAVSSDWVNIGFLSTDYAQESGLLTVSLPFQDGEAGWFAAEIYSESKIPEPGTFPLMILTIMGWTAWKRAARRSEMAGTAGSRSY